MVLKDGIFPKKKVENGGIFPKKGCLKARKSPKRLRKWLI